MVVQRNTHTSFTEMLVDGPSSVAVFVACMQTPQIDVQVLSTMVAITKARTTATTNNNEQPTAEAL
jgi:hypothetical protein